MNGLIAILAITTGFQHPTITSLCQQDFRDASFTARVVKGDQAELAKINKDFGNTYRFQYTDIKMKEPFKLRLETNVEDTQVTFILNGTKRLVRIPKARLVDRKDLSGNPGQRQTALDFGMLTPSLFESLFDAKFIRTDRETGAYVFDITYKKALDDTSLSRVWIDPSHHYVMKREWFNQVGRQLATFFYEKPKLVSGVWFPTRLTVKNTDDKVAGITQYESLKVNSGLSDSLFSTN